MLMAEDKEKSKGYVLLKPKLKVVKQRVKLKQFNLLTFSCYELSDKIIGTRVSIKNSYSDIFLIFQLPRVQ